MAERRVVRRATSPAGPPAEPAIPPDLGYRQTAGVDDLDDTIAAAEPLDDVGDEAPLRDLAPEGSPAPCWTCSSGTRRTST